MLVAESVDKGSKIWPCSWRSVARQLKEYASLFNTNLCIPSLRHYEGPMIRELNEAVLNYSLSGSQRERDKLDSVPQDIYG